MKEFFCHPCGEAVAPNTAGNCSNCGASIERINSAVVVGAQERTMSGIERFQREVGA